MNYDPVNGDMRIRDVWAYNLESEMRLLRSLVDKYPYVAMDTEFPGVVARPIGSFKTSSDYHYQTMRCNVDLLKIIQVGITLANEEAVLPQPASTWQFHFRFSVNEDMYAPESIDLLQKSGIDFQRHEEIGIEPNDFAELMITSGLVLTDETRWISFHSGYDFGYFLKLLTADSLPTSEEEFFSTLRIWFPHIYDVKLMMRANKSLKGGLQDVADDLGIMRLGPSHQAGSDSLLTMGTFLKMREIYFHDSIENSGYNGKLYGLGQTYPMQNGITDPSRGGATIAERDDRSLIREQNQTPAPGQNQNGGLAGLATGPLPTPALGGALPAPLPPTTTYGPMGANAPFIRTAIGVGGAGR